MRISCTTLDQYLLFQQNEWYSEAMLLASIRGEFVPTPQVKAGMAFEQIIQDPARHALVGTSLYQADGFIFPAEAVDAVAPTFDPAGVWQAKETLTVDVHGIQTTVVCKVDHLFGNQINELKTRWSGFDCEKYMDAYQWRWYLLVFGAASVRYTVACFRDPEEPRFESVEAFSVFPYIGMREDCIGLLHEFMEYVQMRGLQEYLADNRPRRDAA